MVKIELTKQVGPYARGAVIEIDEKGAAQLIESKRGKAVVDKTAPEPVEGD